jgi:DNA replication protein DnaC
VVLRAVWAWVGRLKPTLRQVHTAGERVFADFAGHTMEVIDGATGEVCRAEVFVGVLGASSYVFAEAAWTQSLPDWIAAHVNRRRTAGCCLRASAGTGHALLQLGRGNSEECSGQESRRPGTAQPVPREHPRFWLLPLKGKTMLIHPLAERLRGLGMAAMADAFLGMQTTAAAAELSREDWLGLLIDREATARDNKRLGRRLSQARLRQAAVVEDTDFRTPRGLHRALFHRLAGCEWIRHSQHLVIGGPTGTGKSWLACALGHKACREGFSVLYRRAPRLFAELATARGEGRLPRTLAMLERTRLLIIDDWGPEPLNAEQRRDLLEIVEDRYEKGSLLVTSQIPVSRWHELIADPTIGDAILDRVVHRAHRIEPKGPSLRKRHGVGASAEGDSAAAPGG